MPVPRFSCGILFDGFKDFMRTLDISLILQCFAAGCKEKMKKPLARFLGTGKWNKRKGYEFLNKRIGEPEGPQEGKSRYFK